MPPAALTARGRAGDQVITRINDRQADIYNRERWEVAEVNAAERTIVLDGIDQARRVEVGPDYLAQTTLGGDASALQHAYAVTTYCAQGTTVDSAYVMADPSMDKQELYVAASRSRGETHLYATPEIQAEREEFAPKPPEAREAIDHIAEAAERDRAQRAAHDEALRSELSRLPTGEIEARYDKLLGPANFEGHAEDDYSRQRRAVAERRAQLEQAVAEREAVEALGWRERRRGLAGALEREELLGERLKENIAELDGMEPAGTPLRQERQIAGELLAKRTEQMLIATRIEPPPYILNELGPLPSDSLKREHWEKGVKVVETYRREHGVSDPNKALGRESPQTRPGTRRAGWQSPSCGSCSAGSGWKSNRQNPGSGGWGSNAASASAAEAPTRAIEAPRSRWYNPLRGSGAQRP